MCRNTTEVITRAHIYAKADDLSHRNHTVSQHISVRSCQWFLMCRNTTEVITRAHVYAKADDLSHRNHTVSQHISVRSCQWFLMCRNMTEVITRRTSTQRLMTSHTEIIQCLDTYQLGAVSGF